MAFLPRVEVDGIDRTPAPYGLFSTFTFRPGGGRWAVGGVTFDTLPCATPLESRGVACGPTPATPPDVSTDPCGYVDATPFIVFSNPTGGTPVGVDHAERAEDVLLAGEEQIVERTLWEGLVGDDGANPSPSFADLTTGDVLGGSALAAGIGIAALEQRFTELTGSAGVLHVSRFLASYLLTEGVLTTSGTRLTTKLGTPVAAGAGYGHINGPGSLPDATEYQTAWAVISSPVMAYRSEVTVYDNFDPAVNNAVANAERTYLLGFEQCGLSAALITTT